MRTGRGARRACHEAEAQGPTPPTVYHALIVGWLSGTSAHGHCKEVANAALTKCGPCARFPPTPFSSLPPQVASRRRSGPSPCVDLVNEPPDWPLEVLAITQHKAPVPAVAYRWGKGTGGGLRRGRRLGNAGLGDSVHLSASVSPGYVATLRLSLSTFEFVRDKQPSR